MENRIKELEEFQKKWKFYFWAIVIIGTLSGTLLGIKISNINDKIDNLNSDLSRAEEYLEELRLKSSVAKITSDNALKQAGDLDKALLEARTAYENAALAANKSIESSKIAIEASNNALKASNESRAISETVNIKIRNLEQIISDIKNIKVENDQKQKVVDKKIFVVKLKGVEQEIHFIEGDSPYDEVDLTQSYYKGVVYIPKNTIAKIEGNVQYSKFHISKELKGKIIDNTIGVANIWNQE